MLLGPMCLFTLVAFASNKCAGECSLDTGGKLAIAMWLHSSAHLQYTVAGLSEFYLIKTFSQTTSGSNI